MNTKRRFVGILLAFAGIVAIGTIGYIIIGRWSLLDALYMTITTLSTVGFREVHELSKAGQIFTIFLIIGGTGTMLYAATSIVQYLLERNLANMLGRRFMKERISNLKKHVILCGYGKVGKEVAHVFENEHTPFVIIETDEKAADRATNDGHLCINMNATSDEALKEAGIMNARALVAALGSDADNLY
ncbi:MAG: potassium channel family protein, partial [Dehalococcoidales bacterium]|nr:potassium channel family protein [Dehalococcoidales bacterium]